MGVLMIDLYREICKQILKNRYFTAHGIIKSRPWRQKEGVKDNRKEKREEIITKNDNINDNTK
jgi:hypothetical protein